MQHEQSGISLLLDNGLLNHERLGLGGGWQLGRRAASRCHQLGPSITPDLRRLNAGLHDAFKDILLRGALAPAGMERFDDLLSEQDADNVHAYLIEQSWIAYRAEHATGEAR